MTKTAGPSDKFTCMPWKIRGEPELKRMMHELERGGPEMILKTLSDISVGDTVFRFIGSNAAPMLLRVTVVAQTRIICGEWQFDKETGAEIDDFLGWGPALTGSHIRAVPSHDENN